MGANPPPPNKNLKSGGLTGVQPPPIQNSGGVATPQPPPPRLVPLIVSRQTSSAYITWFIH